MYSNKQQRGFAHLLLIIIAFVAVAAISLFAIHSIKKRNSDNAVKHPQQFIQADFIDLSKIYNISKFRSAQGHDFSGNGETCRSMKHYYYPQMTNDPASKPGPDGLPPKPDGVHDIDIYSPVDGKIIQIAQERKPIGEQIYIRPDNAHVYTVRLFHIFKLDGIKEGVHLKAGQKIGVIGGYSGTDIAIDAGRDAYVSYFSVMPDSIFAKYQARGAKSRDDFILSRAYRDAHPVPCNQGKTSDQAFQYPSGYDHANDEFHLSGYVMPIQPQTNTENKPDPNGYHNCGNSCGQNQSGNN